MSCLVKPSDQVQKERLDIISALRKEPNSEELQGLFDILAGGSSPWDIDTFINGIKHTSSATRSQGESLKGMLDISTFSERWDSTYPQLATTIWDLDFIRQCPPGWRSTDEGVRHLWTLRYHGEGPLSQGLNELIRGPTILDCGMWCQLLLWTSIRYLTGDELFDKIFQFKKGEFFISQDWMENSLLYPFYDVPDPAEPQRIHTRTFYNHPSYQNKHPGGLQRLQNVTKVDKHCYTFIPAISLNALSEEELDRELYRGYNKPRDQADFLKLCMYSQIPDYVHPYFKPRSYGHIVEEARHFEQHTLTDQDWDTSRGEREQLGDGLHLAFSFQRLITCLEEAKSWCLKGRSSLILARARQLQVFSRLSYTARRRS